MLLRLALDESSAKVRTGWPADDQEDYDLPIWAGVIPFTGQIGLPVRDPALRFALDPPDYIVNYQHVRNGTHVAT
jgi:hypothetical protein